MHQPIEALGRLLPAYDFECLIAKGGMGAVYKAKQRSLGRDVAIKILPPEVGRDPLFRRSFETEARAMARLNHPNLIGVYDSGSVADMLYIVMEYVPGKSLYHSSYGKMVDPVQAVELIQGICAGLSHAHENGIIHSDIKPANVLLTPKAEPKIGEFGLARLVESEGDGHPRLHRAGGHRQPPRGRPSLGPVFGRRDALRTRDRPAPGTGGGGTIDDLWLWSRH